MAECRIRTDELMQGMVLKLTMPRTLSLRMRFGAWLIGLAGRIINVPCEIELASDTIKPGDVVHDLWDARGNMRFAKVMTVHSVDGGRAECAWFEGDALRHRRFNECAWFEGDALRHRRFNVASLVKIEGDRAV